MRHDQTRPRFPAFSDAAGKERIVAELPRIGSAAEIHRRVIGAAKSINGNPFDIRSPVTGAPNPVLRLLFDAMIEK